MNGANPLLMSNNGKSALDEASDIRMKQLLERYISRRKRYLMSGKNQLSRSCLSRQPLSIVAVLYVFLIGTEPRSASA